MTTLRSVDGFERALARGLPPIVWISGDEPLLVIEAADAVRARARLIGFAERQIIDLGARFDFSLLTEATRSMSLFGERRLVDIRLAGKPSKEFGDALREALPTLGDDCRLLVTGDRLERATTSTAWFGALEPALLWYETPRVDRDALPGWLASRLARQRQTGSPLVLALIADRTEGNLLAAHQEIQRLALLLPAGELDPGRVDEIVLDSARYEVFGLIDAALAGDTVRALRIVDGLHAEDAALPLVAWGLADALRRLARARQALADGQPIASALRGAGVFGRREAAMRQALSRRDPTPAARLLRETAQLDRIFKGVGSGIAGSADDPWAAVERIVIGLSGGRRLSP